MIGGGTARGGVNVGGCGGGYGIMFNSGCGGGAGGTILIEAPSVSVLSTGVLAANGGGGGSYSSVGGHGTLDATAAPGSPGTGDYGRAGDGAAGSDANGGWGLAGSAGGGGAGGGAAGIMRIHNLSGTLAPAPGAILSPTLNAKNNATPQQTVCAIGAITVQ